MTSASKRWIKTTLSKFLESESDLLPSGTRQTPTHEDLKNFTECFINTGAITYDGQNWRTYTEDLVKNIQSDDMLLLGFKTWFRDQTDLEKVKVIKPKTTGPPAPKPAPMATVLSAIPLPPPRPVAPAAAGGFAAPPPPRPTIVAGGVTIHAAPAAGPVGLGGFHQAPPAAGMGGARYSVSGAELKPVFDNHANRLLELETKLAKVLEKNESMEVTIEDLTEMLGTKDVDTKPKPKAMEKPAVTPAESLEDLRQKNLTLRKQLERELEASKAKLAPKPKTEDDERAKLAAEEARLTAQIEEARRARGQPKPKSVVSSIFSKANKDAVRTWMHSFGLGPAPEKK